MTCDILGPNRSNHPLPLRHAMPYLIKQAGAAPGAPLRSGPRGKREEI